MITLGVDGVDYSGFQSGVVNIALDTLANDFTFTAAMKDGETWPDGIRVGKICNVKVDGELVLTGSIEKISGSYAVNAHKITISGRDNTSDLIDSSIGAGAELLSVLGGDPLNDIKAPISLKSIIEKVISHIGSSLLVVDEVGPDLFVEAEDIIVPQPGDNAFEFVEQYAQKRQVLLTSNADGNVVITRSKGDSDGLLIINVPGSSDSNVKSCVWSSDYSERFQRYITKGQQDPIALNSAGATDSGDIANQEGFRFDGDIQTGRQFVAVQEIGFSSAMLQDRADWSKKIRKARSTLYSATVQGFTQKAPATGNDVMWHINTLVSVVDEIADISRVLLINSVRFSFDDGGSISELQFVEKNAYELLASEPKPVGSNQDIFQS